MENNERMARRLLKKWMATEKEKEWIGLACRRLYRRQTGQSYPWKWIGD